MKTFRFILMFVGILMALGMARLAEAQVVGPFCTHITTGLGGLSINVRVFAMPTGGNQFLLTGVPFGGLGVSVPITTLSGSAFVEPDNTSTFQVTVGGASSEFPTLFIWGHVNNTTGDGAGRCESNVENAGGCTVEGVNVTFTGIAC
jgi:hypothetical protein